MLRSMSVLVVLAVTCVVMADAKPPAKKGMAGIWLGTLKAGAIELRIAFHIKDEGGKLTATMESVDQGVKGLEVEKLTFENQKITLAMPKFKITYTGEVQPDGETIKGEFEQGQKFAMDLKRVDQIAALKRPQHPKRPFPYREEEVTFDSLAKDVKMAGTLTLPKGDGPFPAVILISGSGPQNRDEEILGHKPFLVIADHLSRRGIAVLRFDDRGVGKSTGNHATANSRDFAQDVHGGVKFLKARKDIAKIGLVGHSEGGIIAPMVAVDSADVAFIVLLAGTGLPGDEILSSQIDANMKASGIPEALRNKLVGGMSKLIAEVKKGASKEELRKYLKELEKGLSEEEKKAAGAGPDGSSEVDNFTSNWFRFFFSHDPRTVLKKVKCPVLALNGELDLQVLPKLNLPEIEKALKESGNTDVTLRELPGLNHLFQVTKTGLPSEYGKLEETFSKEVLEILTAWIEKRK